MRKLYLTLLVIVMVLIIVVIYYLTSSEPSFIEVIQEGLREQEIDATVESPVAPVEQTEGNTSGTGGGGGSGGTGGGSENNTIIKVNYTLTVDSFPQNLSVLTNYSINGIDMTFEQDTPYSALIESGTIACALLTSSVKGGTVITWELDGQECEPYLCSGFIGCGVLMDGHHTVAVHYSTPS